MYNSSIPHLMNGLTALSKILSKAEAHCEARKIDKAVMLSQRLFPDMFNLTKQVQLASDFAKGPGARLAGMAVPSFADTETTFEELQARLAKTQEFLKSVPQEAYADAAQRVVTIKVGGQERNFSGADYFYGQALPNFYFHLATAYNILRHNGVELGKADFMGRG